MPNSFRQLHEASGTSTHPMRARPGRALPRGWALSILCTQLCYTRAVTLPALGFAFFASILIVVFDPSSSITGWTLLFVCHLLYLVIFDFMEMVLAQFTARLSRKSTTFKVASLWNETDHATDRHH